MLEDIIELFRRETDIPLELPLVTTLSLVSGHLNSQGVTVDVGFSLECPKLWTVVLAPSGAGKSFALATVEKMLSGGREQPPVPMLQNAASAAMFVDNVEETPRGLWVRDEFGQFLNQINELQHMEEIKDILLNAYSGRPIERRTRAKSTRIEAHALSILGLSVAETFESQIGAESLVDGFAQRFNYLLADADPARPVTDFPIYFEGRGTPDVQARLTRIESAWRAIIARRDLEGAVFSADEPALAEFKETFRSMYGDAEIPKSFYRRTLFSMFSYAAVYHVLTGTPGTVLTRDSMSLAARMVGLHLDHGRRLLNGYGLSDLEKAIRKAEDLRDRRKAAGREIKPRDLVANIREIHNARMAREIMDLMRPDDK